MYIKRTILLLLFCCCCFVWVFFFILFFISYLSSTRFVCFSEVRQFSEFQDIATMWQASLFLLFFSFRRSCLLALQLLPSFGLSRPENRLHNFYKCFLTRSALTQSPPCFFARIIPLFILFLHFLFGRILFSFIHLAVVLVDSLYQNLLLKILLLFQGFSFIAVCCHNPSLLWKRSFSLSKTQWWKSFVPSTMATPLTNSPSTTEHARSTPILIHQSTFVISALASIGTVI